MTRRYLLGLLTAAGGLAAAGVVGLPAVLAALSPAPLRRRSGEWRAVGRLEDFPLSQVRAAAVDGSRAGWPPTLGAAGVFVWRPSAEEVVVFSRSCTDLGCPLTYDPGSACFFCPCHGGIFFQDGAVLAGPPARPMQRYATRTREGLLEIDLASLPPAH